MTEASELLPAEGTLAELPMAELLVRLDRAAFSGTLEVTASHRRNVVVLAAGHATKVRLAVPIEMLGRLLIEQGLVGAEQVESTAARQAAAGGRLGDLLVAAGAVDRAAIDRALADQLRRRLLRLFLLPAAGWRLVPETDLLTERGGAPQPLDLLAVLADGVRSSHSVDTLEGLMLEALAGRTATAAVGPDLGRLQLTPQEQSACRYLARGDWGATVFRAIPAEHRHALLVAAYCLHVTGQLRFSTTVARASVTPLPPVGWSPSVPPPATPAPRIAPSSVPPSRPEAEAPDAARAADDGSEPVAGPDREAEAQLLGAYERLGRQTYYELLGVPPDATPDALKAAYLERVKRCHPDRAVRLGLAQHRSKLEAIVLQVREAFETLSDPEARAKYDARLAGTTETTAEQVGEMIDRALAAERAYQMAVMFERQHRLDEAQQQADEALRLQPEQGEFLCMSLWLQAVRRPANAAVNDLVPGMTEAAGRVVSHERAQMQTARLLQRAGRSREALDYFRRVLRRNPQNVDAAREVRLVELRQSKQQAEPAGGGGLFGRLFGKKDK
ncbi:MAG: DnaJ domain-containing protein [Deltaproteobacteria bacterium]|nr:DnaJ domain-containing protein [Deltaproteobacteria bacterium]